MQHQAFERDLAADELAAEEIGDIGEEFEEDVGAEGFEEDAFEEDAYVDEAAEEGLFAEDAYEGEDVDVEAIDEDAYEAEAYEEDIGDEYAAETGEDYDAWEDAFGEAMDAEDDDEFLSALRRVAGPLIQRARPAMFRFLRRQAGRAGGWLGQQAAQRLGVNPRLGAQAGRRLGSWLGGMLPQQMDALAEAAVDDGDVDAYVPMVAGLAGRVVAQATTTAAQRARAPQRTQQVARAAMRATAQAARTLTRRVGPQAIRAVPRLVRQVARVARQQRVSPRAVPQMIRRAAQQVAQSPRAARRLSRPNPQARRVARQLVRPTAARARRRGPRRVIRIPSGQRAIIRIG